MLLALAALLIQLAPIPTPAGAPPPSFALHGFAGEIATEAPVLSHRADGRSQVALAFVPSLDGACMVAQLVDVHGRSMALRLAGGPVETGVEVRATVALPTKADLSESEATADGVTIVVVCGAPDDQSSLAASTVYHAAALAPDV